MHCSGSGQRQARGATTTAHLHFLHRCILGVVRTSLRVVTVERLVSRQGVQSHGLSCQRLLGGSRTCCSETQGELNILLQTFDGLGGEPIGYRSATRHCAALSTSRMQCVTLCPPSSSHEKRLQQTVCRRRLCLLACEGSGLGPEGDDEPDPGLDEETGRCVAEPGLTMKDLQILVDNAWCWRSKTQLQQCMTSQKR